MITQERARTLSISVLHYARLDIVKTIEIQEKGEREFPGTFPKLGQYWDELSNVLGEISRRQKGGVA